ncbi:hypothetical protein VUR80DRAFT_8707 [Thermomyces stellatus]
MLSGESEIALAHSEMLSSGGQLGSLLFRRSKIWEAKVLGVAAARDSGMEPGFVWVTREFASAWRACLAIARLGLHCARDGTYERRGRLYHHQPASCLLIFWPKQKNLCTREAIQRYCAAGSCGYTRGSRHWGFHRAFQPQIPLFLEQGVPFC